MKQAFRRLRLKLALWREDLRDAGIGSKVALFVGVTIVSILLIMGFIALVGVILTAMGLASFVGSAGASSAGVEKTSVFLLLSSALIWIGAAIIVAPIAAFIFRVAGVRDARRRWLAAVTFTVITGLLVKVYTLAVDTSVSGVAPALAFLGIGLVVVGFMTVLLCRARLVGTLGAIAGLLVLGAATWQLGWPTWVSATEEQNLRSSYPEDAVMSPTGVARYCRPIIPKFDSFGQLLVEDIWPEIPPGFDSRILKYRCNPNRPGREPLTALEGTVLTPEDNLRLAAVLPPEKLPVQPTTSMTHFTGSDTTRVLTLMEPEFTFNLPPGGCTPKVAGTYRWLKWYADGPFVVRSPNLKKTLPVDDPSQELDIDELIEEGYLNRGTVVRSAVFCATDTRSVDITVIGEFV